VTRILAASFVLLLVGSTIARADDVCTGSTCDADSSASSPWKIAALTGGIATVGMAGGFIYSVGKLRDTGPAFTYDAQGRPVASDNPLSFGGYCTKDPSGNYRDTVIDPSGKMHAVPKDTCAHGGFYTTLGTATGIGMIVGAGFTMFAVYKGYIAGNSREKKAPKSIVVTPVISPDGAGATLRLDW
jgi:hypothetical protein